MKRIKLGFNYFSDARLETKAQAIVVAMTGNAHFPAVLPQLAAVSTALAAYVAALAAAANRGIAEVAVKNQKRAELETALIILGNYITLEANGDELVLASTGYDMVKTKTSSPPLTMPEIKFVDAGMNAGELDLVIYAVKGAKMYGYEYTPDPVLPNVQWTSQFSTQVKFTFKNLESGQKYWCRVAAMGVNEQLVYSNPVARIVQ